MSSSGLKAPRELVPPSPPFSPIYGRVQKTSVKEAHNGECCPGLGAAPNYKYLLRWRISSQHGCPFPWIPAALAHRMGLFASSGYIAIRTSWTRLSGRRADRMIASAHPWSTINSGETCRADLGSAFSSGIGPDCRKARLGGFVSRPILGQTKSR